MSLSLHALSLPSPWWGQPLHGDETDRGWLKWSLIWWKNWPQSELFYQEDPPLLSVSVPSIPPTHDIPDSHPPSFILPDPLPHYVSALHLSSSLSCFLLSFLILPPLVVITLNLSSSVTLFCDGNPSLWRTLTFGIISCVQETYLQKEMFTVQSFGLS